MIWKWSRHLRNVRRSRANGRPRLLGLALVLALVVAGCGGGDDNNNPAGPGPGTGGTGPMSATIDGQSWAAGSGLVVAQTVPSTPGAFVVQGSKVISATDAISVQLILYNIAGPGTYPLGTGPTVNGGQGIVASAAAGFGTTLSGNAGTVTITALTPTRIAGTFSFVAKQNYGGTGGTRTVTNGQFDATLSSGGSLPSLPAKAGGHVSATLGGSAWNAATAIAQQATTAFILVASNDQYIISMTISGAGLGTNTIDDVNFTSNISVNAGVVPSGECCWGPGAGQSGTVTFTTLGPNRAIGTFTATVPAAGASGPLSITSGDFDIGLQ